MCSLNSNLQLLRHIPEFFSGLEEWINTSDVVSTIHFILSHCGSPYSLSAISLRESLARATGRNLNSGEQNDTVELLNYLLDYCPSELFYFDTSVEYRFWINNCAVPCPNCGQFPDKVTSSSKILSLPLPQTALALPLDYLLNNYFSIQFQQHGRSCGHCSARGLQSPKLPFKEKLNISKYPQYLLIQLVRMTFRNGKTIKNSTPVLLPDTVCIDKCNYSVIGTITHMGTADAGHNRAYLKHGNKWYCCEDSKLPEEKMPTDSPTEQNYCILLKKCPASSNSISVKPCQVDNIPRQCQKPSLKHFISDESLQSNDEAKVDVQACRGCNKPFSRLLYHLKNSHACSKLYDMIALQKEMENAKKNKK